MPTGRCLCGAHRSFTLRLSVLPDLTHGLSATSSPLGRGLRYPAACTFSRQAKLRLTMESSAAFSGQQRLQPLDRPQHRQRQQRMILRDGMRQVAHVQVGRACRRIGEGVEGAHLRLGEWLDGGAQVGRERGHAMRTRPTAPRRRSSCPAASIETSTARSAR